MYEQTIPVYVRASHIQILYIGEIYKKKAEKWKYISMNTDRISGERERARERENQKGREIDRNLRGERERERECERMCVCVRERKR